MSERLSFHFTSLQHSRGDLRGPVAKSPVQEAQV